MFNYNVNIVSVIVRTIVFLKVVLTYWNLIEVGSIVKVMDWGEWFRMTYLTKLENG